VLLMLWAMLYATWDVRHVFPLLLLLWHLCVITCCLQWPLTHVSRCETKLLASLGAVQVFEWECPRFVQWYVWHALWHETELGALWSNN